MVWAIILCAHLVTSQPVLRNKPKSELSEEDLRKKEEEEFQTGPLSVLTQSVKHNTQVCSAYLHHS